MIGTTIDSYEVTGVVAEGATGDLLVARMPGAQATVAIRLYAASLSADREAIQRCFDDATKAGGLNHSGVARVLFSGFHGDRAFLVFDHADGETLAARLAKGGRMSSTQVADLARKIADVLATAHAAKIQHRDLRPERILIVPDASGHEGVSVIDFGASHLEPTPATPSAATYAAPERWTNPGSVGVLADMYSLGAIAFHMATGQTPFHGSIDELRAQHLSAPPPPARGVMPDIPAPREHLVGKMMAKSPGERPTRWSTSCARSRCSAAARSPPRRSRRPRRSRKCCSRRRSPTAPTPRRSRSSRCPHRCPRPRRRPCRLHPPPRARPVPSCRPGSC